MTATFELSAAIRRELEDEIQFAAHPGDQSSLGP
jgi:hypothetical protein